MYLTTYREIPNKNQPGYRPTEYMLTMVLMQNIFCFKAHPDIGSWAYNQDVLSKNRLSV